MWINVGIIIVCFYNLFFISQIHPAVVFVFAMHLIITEVVYKGYLAVLLLACYLISLTLVKLLDSWRSNMVEDGYLYGSRNRKASWCPVSRFFLLFFFITWSAGENHWIYKMLFQDLNSCISCSFVEGISYRYQKPPPLSRLKVNH